MPRDFKVRSRVTKLSRVKFKTVDQYISTFPRDTQAILEEIRQVIRTEVPNAEEGISYNIPAFKIGGKYPLYYAGYKAHIGIYPIPVGTDEFNKKLEPYVAGKGTLRFPLDRPIPSELLKEIIKYSLSRR